MYTDYAERIDNAYISLEFFVIQEKGKTQCQILETGFVIGRETTCSILISITTFCKGVILLLILYIMVLCHTAYCLGREHFHN